MLMNRHDRCRRSLCAFFIWTLCLLPAVPVAGQPQSTSATLPALASALSEISHAEFCGESVPFDNSDVRERFEKEMLLSLWNRPQVLLWLKRSDRYLGVIETILADQGMPADLKYIAVIESALRPHAGSRKGAVGFWQFLPDTARRYGLTVTDRRDERRNIFDSTRAAAAYFSDLHERFGSWTLAAAAYNLGEERLAAEIEEQGVDRYYDLYLPLETQRYVLKVLSAKLILEAPERYGFFLPPEDRWRPLSFDQVRVECSQETPLRLVAAAAETTFKRIKDLNPEIRGHSLGPGEVDIRVPAPAPPFFTERFESLTAEYIANRQRQLYVVREGDNLTLIAERFGVSLSSLLIWNRLDPNRTIHPGDRLFVYPEVADTEEGNTAETVTVE
jgi:hypothetical protein